MRNPIWVSRTIVLLSHNEALARDGGAAGVRDTGLLESALARPQNLHAYDSNADAAALAAAYAFGIVRIYPFVDGNKRTGFLVAVFFLELNGLRFIANEVDATVQTLALAASEIDEAEFARWLRANVRLR